MVESKHTEVEWAGTLLGKVHVRGANPLSGKLKKEGMNMTVSIKKIIHSILMLIGIVFCANAITQSYPYWNWIIACFLLATFASTILLITDK